LVKVVLSLFTIAHLEQQPYLTHQIGPCRTKSYGYSRGCLVVCRS